MKYSYKYLLKTLILVLMPTFVLAAPPLTGFITDGIGVPGASLGDTRAHIEFSYGSPDRCYDDLNSDCSYNIEDQSGKTVGYVRISYQAEDGGEANFAQDDVVRLIEISETFSGIVPWVTSSGYTLHELEWGGHELIANAYPNAVVGTNVRGDTTYTDTIAGLEIEVHFDRYTGRDFVNYMVTLPSGASLPIPQPLPEELPVESMQLQVTGLDGSVIPAGRRNEFMVSLTVVDENGQPVANAAVVGNWRLPNGRIRNQVALSDSQGGVSFTLKNRRVGDFVFSVTDVSKDDLEFVDNLSETSITLSTQ